MKKILKIAAASLLVTVSVVGAVGCSFEFEQPDWVTQALCDHVFDEEVLEEVTCTEDGRVMKVCSDCGKTKIVTVKATGHDVVEDEAIAATCSTPGLTAGSHCKTCGTVIVKQEDTSLAAHIDEDNNGSCDVCNGSIFENATFATVEKGDVLNGWYRVGVPALEWNEAGNPANMTTGTLVVGMEKLVASSNTVTMDDEGTTGYNIDNVTDFFEFETNDHIIESDSTLEDGWYMWALGQTYNLCRRGPSYGEYTFIYFPESVEVTYKIGYDNDAQTQDKTVTVSGFTFDSCTFSFEKVVFN